MPDPYLSGDTLDDLLHAVFEAVLKDGTHTNPSKGPARELAGVLLELKNPRARLSRTESRGKPFSCLGELCWYLAGSNDTAFITHYITEYRELDEDGVIFGAYGPRLVAWKGVNQIENAVNLLKRTDSRRAVIQLFDATDLAADHEDVPCTCTLQFLARENALHLLVNMRSNDAYIGLPHDVFCFTMLQEILARTLDVDIGFYKHAAGSLHIYETHIERAEEYLKEGFQSTAMPMPRMPKGDPWPSIEKVLRAEKTIRTSSADINPLIADLQPYWADLIRLLRVYRSFKEEESEAATRAIKDTLTTDVFDLFVDQKLRGASQ